MPPLVAETTVYNLRSSQNYSVPLTRLTLFQQSFFPATLKLWNDLDISLRNSPSVDIFKCSLRARYCRYKKPPAYYFIGNRHLNILHTRLRQKCSSLKHDLFRAKLIENSICSCGTASETVEHYFMSCKNYHIPRLKLQTNLLWFNFRFDLNTLLYGVVNDSYENNCLLFQHVQLYIKETGRFTST